MTDKIQINHVSKVFKVRDTAQKREASKSIQPLKMFIFP